MRLLIALAVLVSSAAGAATVAEQIVALPEAKQKTMFARSITASGEHCPSVTRLLYQGSSSDGAGLWSVACSGGKDWQVLVKNDSVGSSKVLECSVLKAVGGGQCWQTFKKKK